MSSKPNQPGSGVKNKTEKEIQKQKNIEAFQKQYDEQVDQVVELSLKPIPAVTGISPSSQTLRYPCSPDITDDTDYVLFQFYNYKPPFKNASFKGKYANTGNKLTKDQANKIIQDSGSEANYGKATKKSDPGVINIKDYNDAGKDGMYADAQKASGYNNIVLYMPEDVSTGFRAQWGGKNLTNFASGVLSAAGADGFDKLKRSGDALAGAIGNVSYIAGAQAISKFLSATSGDQISNDDVFGAISGAILNPNTELLFSGVDMRNFVLNFKLVPRDEKEAGAVNSIVAHFKKASLPSRVPDKIFGNDSSIKRNFIGAPKLVRVSFMSGENEHPFLPRYKMCALTQVDVNYTPDGVYSTYEGGQPVAIQMSLNFQETKIVFADEVDAHGVGGLR